MRHNFQTDVLMLLGGGDRRSIGHADEAARIVSANAKLFPGLIAGLWSDDALVRMRAADAAEKITRNQPQLLAAHKKELLGLLCTADQQELRWHLAAMIPRLPLNRKELQTVASAFNRYLEDRSSIVKTYALQGLAELAEKTPGLRTSVMEVLTEASRKGTPAMKARSRKLLLRLRANE